MLVTQKHSSAHTTVKFITEQITPFLCLTVKMMWCYLDKIIFAIAIHLNSKNADHPVTKLSAKELTRDHHPSRDDEKARIEAAGGFVRVWGVPRVNGILAVSRSIGDIYLKR